jgi:hypothetical protein
LKAAAPIFFFERHGGGAPALRAPLTPPLSL